LVELGGRMREVTKQSSDFAFAGDGALFVLGPTGAKGGDRSLSVVEGFDAAPREVGRATSFAVSPGGGEVALLSTEAERGEAFGSLSRLVRAGGGLERMGERVNDLRFDRRGDLLFLARYDARARAGVLMTAAPGRPPREIAQRVQSFTVEGGRVLYRVPAVAKGDFRVELWTAPLDGSAAPRKVDDGVYGHQLAPDGKLLFWKSRCAGGPRSCSLFRAPVDGSAPPQLLATEVAGFDLSEDGRRILIQRPHQGATRAIDLAVLAADAPAREGPAAPLVADVEPNARFLDAGGHRVAFAALDQARAGVYLLDVP
jgi:hypothetical protein